MLGVVLPESWPEVSELTSSLTVGVVGLLSPLAGVDGGVVSPLAGVAGAEGGVVSPLAGAEGGVVSPLAGVDGAEGGVLLPPPELLPDL